MLRHTSTSSVQELRVGPKPTGFQIQTRDYLILIGSFFVFCTKIDLATHLDRPSSNTQSDSVEDHVFGKLQQYFPHFLLSTYHLYVKLLVNGG